MFEYQHEPWRSLYLLYDRLTTMFIRKPFWYLISIPPFLRPRPSWTIKRCVTLREMVRWNVVVKRCAEGSLPIYPYLTMVVNPRIGEFDWPSHLSIEEGPGVQGVWVEPSPELIFGDVQKLAVEADVRAERIPAYWMYKVNSTLTPSSPLQEGEKIIMHLHGGGYSALSAHPRSPTSGIARSLLSSLAEVHRVFSPEYRLAQAHPLPPANAFPAQLIDALAAYNHLVNVVGVDPADIIVEGDSAGGGLAVQLTLYLIEHREDLAKYAERTGTRLLAPPGALLLLSPWVDVGTSHHTPVPSYWARSDFIMYNTKPESFYSERAVCGPHGWPSTFSNTNRYLSPVSRAEGAERVSFAGWPRTFINGGGAERLIDSIRALKERMSADMGEGLGEEQVFYYEAEDGIHDYLGMEFHEPERSETLAKIADWVREG